MTLGRGRDAQFSVLGGGQGVEVPEDAVADLPAQAGQPGGAALPGHAGRRIGRRLVDQGRRAGADPGVPVRSATAGAASWIVCERNRSASRASGSSARVAGTMAGIRTSLNMICDRVRQMRGQHPPQQVRVPIRVLARDGRLKALGARLLGKLRADRPMDRVAAPPQFQSQRHEGVEIAGRAERVNQDFRHRAFSVPDDASGRQDAFGYNSAL